MIIYLCLQMNSCTNGLLNVAFFVWSCLTEDLFFLVDPNDAIEIIEEPKKVAKRKSTDVEPKEPEKKPKLEKERSRRRSETKVDVDGQIETHTTLSPKTPPGDPPEPEELIKVRYEYC